MNICMYTYHFEAAYGIERGIELIAKAGFESLDYSLWDPGDQGILTEPDEVIAERFTKIRKKADECGVYFQQIHAPSPSWCGDPERDEKLLAGTIKSIMAAGILGAKYAVVHPPVIRENKYGSHTAENRVINMEYYPKLLPAMRKWNVKTAIENMFNWDSDKGRNCPTCCSGTAELIDHVDTLNEVAGEEMFVVCLDTGHCNLSGDAPLPDMVRALGSRLKTLHIHDNYGIHDEHMPPGFGNIDWDAFMEALRDINYTGDFVYESDKFPRHFDPSMTFDEGVFQYKLARNLCERHGF